MITCRGLVQLLLLSLAILTSCKDSSGDPSPATKEPPVFPSAVGTVWRYSLSYYSRPLSNPVWGGYVYDEHAAIQWTVSSRDSVVDSLICQVAVLGQDTMHITHYEYGVVVSDTIYTNPTQSQWRLIFCKDAIILNWYSTLVPSYYYTHSISQSMMQATDTLKVQPVYLMADQEQFVRGVGLVFYSYVRYSQSGWAERELRLKSWSTP